MKTIYYRMVVGTFDIFEAVEVDCPRGDPRRFSKPDSSWIPNAIKKFPEGIAWWTEFGLRRYISTGLLAWQASVVDGPVEVVLIEKPENGMYEDEYMLVCDSTVGTTIQTLELSVFLKDHQSPLNNPR